jgi:hypothetical protein
VIVNFLKELAFLTDITGHLNDLNTKLQGSNCTKSVWECEWISQQTEPF